MAGTLRRALLAVAPLTTWFALPAAPPVAAVVPSPIVAWAAASTVGFPVASGDGNAIAVAPSTVRDVPSGVERTVAGEAIHALDRSGRRALTVDLGSPTTVLRVRDLVAGTSRTVDTNTSASGAFALPDFAGKALSADGSTVVFSTFNNGTLETGLWVTVGDGAPRSMTAGRDLGVINRQGGNPAISADGRFVVFEWRASAGFCSLPEPQCTRAVIRYDVQSGTSQVVSVGADGLDAPGADVQPAISGDGRYVAWMSDAISLVPGTTVRRQRLYVRDMATGVTRLAHSGLLSEGFINRPVSMSDDGRRLAVTAIGTVLVGGVSSAAQVINVVDLDAGTIEIVGPGGGAVADAGSRYPFLTASGDAVVFWSDATNLVPGAGVNVYRAVLAPPAARPAEPVFPTFGPDPLAGKGTPVPLRRIMSYVGGGIDTISTDGRYVGSNDGNSIPSSVERYDTVGDVATKVAFVGYGQMSTDGRYVGQAGCRRTIDGGAVVLLPGGAGCLESPAPLSSDGSVLFQAPSTVWRVGVDTRTVDVTAGGTRQLIGRAWLTDDGSTLFTQRLLPNPCSPCTEFVAVDLATGATTPLPLGTASSDGHYLVFSSSEAGLAPGVTTPGPRLYRRDLRTGATVVVHDGPTSGGSVATTGRVAFLSEAPVTLRGAFTIGNRVTVWDDESGRHYVDWAPDGSAPDMLTDTFAAPPLLSGDGRTLAFVSWASNLVTGPVAVIGALLVADVSVLPRSLGSTAVVPERLLDTRTDLGWTGGKPGPDTTVELQVTGAGATAVPTHASAVVLNVTATEATADGFVTVWPCGTARPTASNLNVAAGGTVPNLVVVKLGDDGRVCLYTQSGTHLLADVAAWYPSWASFVPVVPERVLDTRTGLGASGGKPDMGTTVELQVTGAGATAVPADATAVVLNVTATEATADGYVTVWPCGTERPTASNLNLVRGGTRPNLVAVRLGQGGRVCLFTQSGTHLVADVAAWYPPGAAFTAVVPERLLDTRTGVGRAGRVDRPTAGETVELRIAGAGATAVPSDARSVVLNVTATDAAADGFVTVWPCGTARPTASNLNVGRSETAPNLVAVGLGTSGDVCLFTQSGTHLVVDIAGFE